MITVYTQPDCYPCKRVISKFEQAGVTVEIVDITRDLVSAQYVKKCLHAKSTPVIEADGFDPILGYQPDKVTELINAVKGL